jgi:ATP-binding cassette subfamily G (WHITE) protein 2 (PDR)
MSGKVCPVVGAQPGEANVQGSLYLQLKYGYEMSHLWRNFGIIIALMLIFCAIHLLAAEYIPAQRSKGEVLLFQRGHRKTRPQRPSESDEAAASPMFAQDVNKQVGDDAHGKRAETLQTTLQQSSVFHWNNLNYEIKTKHGTKTILNNISGWVKPGTLTALMVIDSNHLDRLKLENLS